MQDEMYIACSTGALQRVKDLLIQKPSCLTTCQSKNSADEYPLYVAAENIQIDVVRYLLCQLNTKCSLNFYELFFYISRWRDPAKQTEILKYIFDNFHQYKFEAGTFNNKKAVNQLHIAAALGNIAYCEKQQDDAPTSDSDAVTPDDLCIIMRQQSVIEQYNTHNSEVTDAQGSDSNNRKLARAYFRFGSALGEHFKGTQGIFETASTYIEKIKEPTNDDLIIKDKIYSSLAYLIEESGIWAYDSGHKDKAEILFMKSCEYIRALKNPNATNLHSLLCNYKKLALIYKSSGLSSKDKNPMTYYQYVFDVLNQLLQQGEYIEPNVDGEDEGVDDYANPYLLYIYQNFQDIFLTNSYEWWFCEMAIIALCTYSANNKFWEVFIKVLNGLHSSPMLPEDKNKWQSHIILFMIYLLHYSEIEDYSNMNGTHYLLNNPQAKASFVDKLDELKKFSTLSLVKTMEHHPSDHAPLLPIVTGLQNDLKNIKNELSALKAELEASKAENALLRSEMNQYRQQQNSHVALIAPVEEDLAALSTLDTTQDKKSLKRKLPSDSPILAAQHSPERNIVKTSDNSDKTAVPLSKRSLPSLMNNQRTQ